MSVSICGRDKSNQSTTVKTVGMTMIVRKEKQMMDKILGELWIIAGCLLFLLPDVGWPYAERWGLMAVCQLCGAMFLVLFEIRNKKKTK